MRYGLSFAARVLDLTVAMRRIGQMMVLLAQSDSERRVADMKFAACWQKNWRGAGPNTALYNKLLGASCRAAQFTPPTIYRRSSRRSSGGK